MKCNFKVVEEIVETPAGDLRKKYNPPRCAKKHNLRECDGEENCTEFAPRDVQVVLRKD